jgi:hypothetical protein
MRICYGAILDIKINISPGGIKVTEGTPMRHSSVAPARALALILIALALAAPAQARRVALVVGNDSYQNVQPLKNARSDANAIAA